jgi:hypothetical protein
LTIAIAGFTIPWSFISAKDPAMRFRRLHVSILLCALVISTEVRSQALADRVLDIDLCPRYVWLACGNGSVTATHRDGAIRRLDKTTGTWTTFTISDIFGTAIEGEMEAVCAVSDSEIWVGLRARNTPEPNSGVAVSYDTGDSWTAFTTADGLASERVSGIEWDEINGDLWVSHSSLVSATDHLSRTPDGGANWHTYRTGNDIIEIAVSDGVLWAAVPHAMGESGNSLIRTDNRGASFTEFTSSQLGGLARMTDAVFAASGSDVIAAADGFFYTYSTAEGRSGVAISNNGGATWTFRSVTGVQRQQCRVRLHRLQRRPLGSLPLGANGLSLALHQRRCLMDRFRNTGGHSLHLEFRGAS